MSTKTGFDRRRTGVLAACTIGNFVSITPAVTMVLSLMLIPIATEFDWPRARVTGVVTLLAVICAVVFPVAGLLADRFGARRVILTGHLAFAASLWLPLLADGSVVQFYSIFAVIGVAAAVPAQPLFSKLLAEWFNENRAFALAFSGGMGNGVGAIVMPAAAGALLLDLGWRQAFAGIGLLVLAIGFPAMALLMKDPPGPAQYEEKGGTGATLHEAVATRLFWIILLALLLGAGCLTAVFTHIVPLLIDRGLPLGTATAVLSSAGMCCAGWQIIVGLILDRSRTPRIIVPMFLAAIAGLLILQWAASLPLLLLGGALIGIGLGSEYGGLPYLLSRYFGLRAYGVIAGAVFGAIVLTQGIVPLLFDAAYDRFGSYHEAIQAVVVALMAGAALLLTLPRYPESTITG